MTGPPGSEEWASIVREIAKSNLTKAQLRVRGAEVPTCDSSLGEDLTFTVPIEDAKTLKEIKAAVVSKSTYANKYLRFGNKVLDRSCECSPGGACVITLFLKDGKTVEIDVHWCGIYFVEPEFFPDVKGCFVSPMLVKIVLDILCNKALDHKVPRAYRSVCIDGISRIFFSHGLTKPRPAQPQSYDELREE